MVMMMLWLSFFHFSYSDVSPLFAFCVRVVTKRKGSIIIYLYNLLVVDGAVTGSLSSRKYTALFCWELTNEMKQMILEREWNILVPDFSLRTTNWSRTKTTVRGSWINHSHLLLDLNYFLVFFCWNYIHWKSWYRAETSSQNWSMEIDICSITYIQQVEDVVYFMYSIVIFYYNVVSALYYVL